MTLLSHSGHSNLIMIENNWATGILSQMRNKDCSDTDFARLSAPLATCLGFEMMSQDLLVNKNIRTPVSDMDAPFAVEHSRYLVPILGAGLALHDPIKKNVIPNGRTCLMAAKRDEKTLLSDITYPRVPEEFDEGELFGLDPMLATGESSDGVFKELDKIKGKVKKRLLTVMACSEGIERLAASHPDLLIYTLSLERLTSKGWLTPGLGDFGNRWSGIVPA